MINLSIVLIIVASIALLILVGIVFSFFSVFLRAWLAGAYVGMINLVAMRLRQEPVAKSGESIWHDFRSGFDYALGFGPIRRLILLVGCMALFGMSFAVLTPVYAREYFGGDARTLGLLMSSSAAGSVMAAIYLSGRRSLRGLGRVIYSGAVLMGLALIAFAYSRQLVLSICCLLLAGGGSILVVASCNTLLQNLVDGDKRGRVMSLYTMAFLGGMPVGSLLTGMLAHHISTSFATTVNGAACLVLGYLFYRQLPSFREQAKPVLIKAGALPGLDH